MGASADVLRMERPDEGSVVRLFSTDGARASATTVPLPWRNHRFVYGCWDINPSGVFIYADPAGAYRVYIGHPADGRTRALELPWRNTDDRSLQRFMDESGVHTDPDNVPRIISVNWLDDSHFMVQPTAAASAPKSGVIGTFDVFRSSGDCLGRFRVVTDFDDTSDSFFIRRDLLVVIEGGKSAVQASIPGIGRPGGPRSTAEDASSDEIRVRVHELFRGIRVH
jgi:hypothetical protein